MKRGFIWVNPTWLLSGASSLFSTVLHCNVRMKDDFKWCENDHIFEKNIVKFIIYLCQMYFNFNGVCGILSCLSGLRMSFVCL